MATHSDFRVLHFNACFGDTANCFNSGFAFVGNQRSESFTIDGQPTGGYLLLNTFDVDVFEHRVQINGQDLPGHDLAPHAETQRWQTRMDPIPGNILRNGENTLTIRRATGADNFLVGEVVVHWREVE